MKPIAMTIRTALSTLFALLSLSLLGADLAAQATITGLSESEATVGTRFDIVGTGFGTKAPKVAFAQDGETVPKTTLKVITPVADDRVTVEVKKAIAGTFTILLTPAGKEQTTAESPDTLSIVRPVIVGIDPEDVGLPGAEIHMTVDQPGSSGHKVTVGGRGAKIVSIEAGSGSRGTDTLSRVTFKVPKSVPDGTWDVVFSNAVGSGTAKGGLAVVGSTKPLGKPILMADIEGLKRFKVSGKKKVAVETSFTGPTTVSGNNKSRAFTLRMPFVEGNSTAPVQYTGAPAFLHYQETQGGTVSLELMSMDDSFTIQVSATQDGLVAGSFCGTLFPVTGGGDPREVSGSFTYDGSFQLEDTGGDTDTNVPKGQPAPGLTIQVLALGGAKGPTGNYEPGDRIKVTYRLAKDDGTSWHLDEMGATRAAVSGPTFNYQRVIAQVSDVKQLSVDNGDGTYTYTFASPIPDVYLPPYNDSDSFGPDDGELTGQPLLDGTYTLGMWFEWSYSVTGVPHEDVGTVTTNFLLGASVTQIIPRDVVSTANCNACHGDLQFHGGSRQTSQLCVLCHTAGSEDKNIPGAAGGTPGASVEYSVMIHKIHNGAHLPTVLGISTDETGMRDYDVPPVPYQLVGFGNSVHDYSDLEFPAWPNITSAMPRDTGYEMLDPVTEKPRDDAMRRGVTDCALCHGDPDGDGPIQAPSQGDLAYTQMRRNTCGSCHDDWIYDRPYTANLQTMPPQLNDATCAFCHSDTDTNLAPRTAHIHPLRDPLFAEGIDFDIVSVTEAMGAEGDGTIGPGDKLELELTIRDDTGALVDPATLSQRNMAITGPSENMNLLLPQQAIPLEMLTGPQPFRFSPPMRVYDEIVGVASPGVDVFMTQDTPLWDLPGHTTEVALRTGFGVGDTTLDFAVTPAMNYVDVLSAVGFARNDTLVIDDGGLDPEYLKIQWVEGNRLWFSSPASPAYAPGPAHEHAAGTTVREVVLAPQVRDVDYSLDAATGTLTELGDFGDGNPVIVTYSTDFIVPETYELALNAGPDLTDSSGTWADKTTLGGTYSAFFWGARDLVLDLYGESNNYREGGDGVRTDFLVGDATTLQPYDLISSAQNCYSCHVNLAFHGGSRTGWESCLACHGTGGSGDRTRYVAANAPETEGVSVNFRDMLHKIHQGEELADADTYTVVGFGQGYPNNFSLHHYGEVVFPVMPTGTQDCASCHGADNTAWEVPDNRDHPVDQGRPVASWAIVCGACHDSSAALAHIDAQTSPVTGAESCSICHDPGKENSVHAVHLVR